MTNKSEELYKACINRVVIIIPDFKPNVAVSNSDTAPRNAFQSEFPHIHITDAYFTIHKLFEMESERQSWQVSIVRILILLNGSAV